MPRDRQGTFEPVTVPKYQRRLDGLSGNVISLYAKGLTTGDIQQHLAEIYGTEVSKDTISRITDQIVEDMVAWQSRPLDPLYAVLVIDCLVIKVRGSQVATDPSTSRSASTSTASVTCSGSGLVPRAARAPSSGRRC